MNESDLTAIALKLADGTPIDWDALKSESPEAHARLLERFQQIEALARLGVSALPEREQLDSIRKALSSEDGAPLRWGHLELLEKIGRGSYGDVYKARDARLDRIVALKLLRGRAEGTQSDSEIIDEARLLARVRHPNVVTVYGAERIEGRVGVWMEFIDGRTLEEEIQAEGPLGAKAICDIGIALCGALTAVHSAGLLHRDIKAQNVMLDVQGRIVLADFGAGRDAQARDTLDTEDIAGTPAYLAPEMWWGASASPQTEVYGLGVLLYRLATRSFPVQGRTTGDIKDAHDRMSRTTCHDANTALPRSLVKVIDRAIDPNPSRRYQSAEALGSALRAVSRASRLRKAVAVSVAVVLAVYLVAILARVTSGVRTIADQFAISPQEEAHERQLRAELTRLAEPYARMDRGGPVSDSDVALLERRVDTEPENLKLLEDLLVAYIRQLGWRPPVRPGRPRPPVIDVQTIEAKRRARIIWLIQQHPDASVAGSFEARVFPRSFDRSYPVDVDGYEQAKAAWLKHTENDGVSVATLDHASFFFEWTDPALAERLLLKAQRREPATSWWSIRLGAFYADASIADRSIRTHNWSPLFYDPDEAAVPYSVTREPFAVVARARLGASQDPHLLIAAGSRLQRALQSGPAPNVGEWVQECYERALHFAPHSVYARSQLVSMRKAPYLSLSPNTLEQAYARALETPESERLLALVTVARNAISDLESADKQQYTGAKDRAALDHRNAEQAARDALKLAARRPLDPDCGTAFYIANLILGSLALRDGDRIAAIKFLDAASHAPRSEWLVYSEWIVKGSLVPALPRKLFAAGEREAVAQFMDRMARINLATRDDLLKMALEIRRGESSLF